MKSSPGERLSSPTPSACETWTFSALPAAALPAALRRFFFDGLFRHRLSRLLRGLLFGRARLEFEADLSVRVLYEEGLETAPLLGNEAGQEIGSPRSQQLLHLLAFDGLLENESPGAKIAGLARAE